MTIQNHRIEKYQYEFYNDNSDGRSRCVNSLYLYNEDKELLCALACIPGKQQADAITESPGGHVSAQISEFQMKGLIDLLRNERPAYYSWNPASQSFRVTTQKEPVGEQELRKLFSFLFV